MLLRLLREATAPAARTARGLFSALVRRAVVSDLGRIVRAMPGTRIPGLPGRFPVGVCGALSGAVAANVAGDQTERK